MAEKAIQDLHSPLSADVQISIDALRTYFRKIQFPLNLKEPPQEILCVDDIDACKSLFLKLVAEVDFTLAFANSGVPVGTSFSNETTRIIKNKILPYLHSARDASAIIHEIFNQPKDHHHILELSTAIGSCYDCFSTTEKEEILKALNVQVNNALIMVSYRIAALGTDEEIHIRAGKDEDLITPFTEQNREVNELLTNLASGNIEKADEDLAQIKIMIRHCRENISLLDKGAESNGASLQQTFILRKLELLLKRLETLLPITLNHDLENAFKALMDFIQEIILVETKPQKLRDFISRNINLIAYRITENKRKTGEHYVSSGRSEYWELFLSACGGGFIVSLMVIFKLLAHDLHLPVLWECLLYSIIYATGFVVIHLLDFTLATKQPAMTAAYIAASLDEVAADNYHHKQFAATIANVSRSQLISIIGNLLFAFPVTLLWTLLISTVLNHSLVPAEQGKELLMAVHPVLSLSFWYAALTGCFLFLTGIVSGFGDNKVVVSRIGLRIEAHPYLKKKLPPEKLKKLAGYIERNLGPWLGNIAFGFMLGFATLTGKLTGLPIDIRHITFSTGNVAMGFYSQGFYLPISLWVASMLGIFMIGFFNLAVSFTLALQVAVRSRGLRLKDYPELLSAVWDYFKKHPRDFILPPSRLKVKADVTAENDELAIDSKH